MPVSASGYVECDRLRGCDSRAELTSRARGVCLLVLALLDVSMHAALQLWIHAELCTFSGRSLHSGSTQYASVPSEIVAPS